MEENISGSTKNLELARESTPSPIKIATWATGKKISSQVMDSMSTPTGNAIKANF